MSDELNWSDVRIMEFASSEMFERIYREGMTLVERAAVYLDGPGREASRHFDKDVTLAYAGESMRMTTRLMQVAAWLLVRKAVQEGEMTAADARAQKYKLGARKVCTAPRMEASEHLPVSLLDLINASERAYAQIARIEEELARETASRPIVADQLAKVQRLFGAHA